MANNNFSKGSYRISLTAMFAALSLIVLYLAAVLPTMNIALYFISSIFSACLLSERQLSLSIILYIVVSLLGVLIIPNIFGVLPYVFLFGHYGIGKYYIEKNIRNKIVAFLIKLVYFDIFMALIYVFANEVFFAGIMDKIPIWAIVLLVQVAFFVYDFIYTQVAVFYYTNIRNKLIRS